MYLFSKSLILDSNSSSGTFETVTFYPLDTMQSFIVPSGVTLMNVDCVASKGVNGYAAGGKGGRVTCVLSTTPGTTLYIMVGSSTNTYNASDIRTTSDDLSSRLVVAGGGGESGKQGTASVGGNGGGLDGENSITASYSNAYANGAVGGNQTNGGAGGTHSTGYKIDGVAGSNGTFGLGGAGGNTGGRGGAGWYGGGGGSYCHKGGWDDYYVTSGGAGGSSYTHPTLCSDVIHTQGFNDGEGYIILSSV